MDPGRGPGKDYKGMDAGPEDVPALLKCIGIDWNIRDSRNIKVSAGAGFLVALTGDIMTMPGLPKVPAAEKVDVDENGRISGLF